eukprot:TRINITY_DN10743_c0_g1_i1.p1 TRINITY_DN10743_c0_g1~~TRINITY_DN10743_c0_g1_i1.p1  ORF type:complete len:1325 (+),score=262.39 TRINITY_DN10743_c0_g1_i1:56-4030(+)
MQEPLLNNAAAAAAVSAASADAAGWASDFGAKMLRLLSSSNGRQRALGDIAPDLEAQRYPQSPVDVRQVRTLRTLAQPSTASARERSPSTSGSCASAQGDNDAVAALASDSWPEQVACHRCGSTYYTEVRGCRAPCRRCGVRSQAQAEELARRKADEENRLRSQLLSTTLKIVEDTAQCIEDVARLESRQSSRTFSEYEDPPVPGEYERLADTLRTLVKTKASEVQGDESDDGTKGSVGAGASAASTSAACETARVSPAKASDTAVVVEATEDGMRSPADDADPVVLFTADADDAGDGVDVPVVLGTADATDAGDGDGVDVSAADGEDAFINFSSDDTAIEAPPLRPSTSPPRCPSLSAHYTEASAPSAAQARHSEPAVAADPAEASASSAAPASPVEQEVSGHHAETSAASAPARPSELGVHLTVPASMGPRSRSPSNGSPTGAAPKPAEPDEVVEPPPDDVEKKQRLVATEPKLPVLPASPMGITITGMLWKRHSNLSRATRVVKLLQIEASKIMSHDGVVDALFSINGAKVGELAREIFYLLRGPGSSSSAKPSGGDPGASRVGRGRGFQESDWGRRRVWLRGSTLGWAKIVDTDERGVSVKPRYHTVEIGPLWGSSVELEGESGKNRFVIQIFFSPRARRRPLSLAAESAVEAERWVKALREACKFPVEQPPPRLSPLRKLRDFWDGRGPEDGKAPPMARLKLEILSSTSLNLANRKQKKNNCNPYVIARIGSSQVRTSTRFGSSSTAVFNNNFNIPLDTENADADIHFELWHDSEFEDHEPTFMGNISVPLYVFGRNKRVEKMLDIRRIDATRSGAVNDIVGNLAVACTVEQKIGHLWLPADPVSQDSANKADFDDIQLQVARVKALVLRISTWQECIADVCHWDRWWYSLIWFLYFQLWVLWLYPYTLSILFLMFLWLSLHLRRKLRVIGVAKLGTGTSRLGVGGQTPRTGQASASRDVSARAADQPRLPRDECLWEVERRAPGVGFSFNYLLDLDPANFCSKDWTKSHRPAERWQIGNELYRYRWKVVVSEDTDENGWQYAPSFSGEWCRAYDYKWSWVRRRLHVGVCTKHITRGTSGEFETGESEVALGLDYKYARNDDDRNAIPQGAVESIITEKDVYRSYMEIVFYIRKDVEYWLGFFEKHMNLFTWKDETVSTVVCCVLTACALLAAVVKTSHVMSCLVCFVFYLGYLYGRDKRRTRKVVINELLKWCASVRRAPPQKLTGVDTMTKLEKNGISLLAVRNWCNQRWQAKFDLRNVEECKTLNDLADRLSANSAELNTPEKRYRAWHSSVYGNFMDHVPSDFAEHDVNSMCYVP